MSEAQDRNKAIIEEFRANGGVVGGFYADKTLLLLHTTGAKSGQERINPAVYIMDGERYVIIASKGGADTHPGWYHNLVANPEVSVEVGTEKFEAIATVAEEPERTQLYEKMVEINSNFGEYPGMTARVIPAIILTRTE